MKAGERVGQPPPMGRGVGWAGALRWGQPHRGRARQLSARREDGSGSSAASAAVWQILCVWWIRAGQGRQLWGCQAACELSRSGTLKRGLVRAAARGWKWKGGGFVRAVRVQNVTAAGEACGTFDYKQNESKMKQEERQTLMEGNEMLKRCFYFLVLYAVGCLGRTCAPCALCLPRPRCPAKAQCYGKTPADQKVCAASGILFRATHGLGHLAPQA